MGRSNRTVRAGPSVDDLVTRARTGDKQAWDALVERYAPLVWSICRRHRLDDADAGDVGQRVWLQLVSQLNQIRDPTALSGWLATTTERECGNIRCGARSSHALGRVLDAEHIPDQQSEIPEHELLAAERHAALYEAFTCLPPGCQRLIAALIQDPPAPCAQISARLGIPVESIGPSRSRCLGKLRRDPAIAALISAEGASAEGGTVPGRQRCRKDERRRPDPRPGPPTAQAEHLTGNPPPWRWNAASQTARSAQNYQLWPDPDRNDLHQDGARKGGDACDV